MRINDAVATRTVHENVDVSNPGYVVYNIYGSPDPSYENYAHAVVACARGKEGSGTEL